MELRLPRGVRVPGLKSMVPFRPGQVLTRHALRRAVRLLYETRNFRQVSAYVRPAPGGVAVTFVLLPRQRIADVSFPGAAVFNRDDLQRISGLKDDQEFLKSSVYKAGRALTAAYRRKGYRQVRIDPEVREGNNAPGRPASSASTRAPGPGSWASGSRAAPAWSRRPCAPPSALDPGTPADLDAVEAALPRLRARLPRGGLPPGDGRGPHGEAPPRVTAPAAGVGWCCRWTRGRWSAFGSWATR